MPTIDDWTAATATRDSVIAQVMVLTILGLLIWAAIRRSALSNRVRNGLLWLCYGLWLALFLISVGNVLWIDI